MRMWDVSPRKMCSRHLLGEHLEMHMFVGHITQGKRLGRFVTEGLVDTRKIQQRHDALAAEMERRGYSHKSPLVYKDELSCGKVSSARSREELRRRCRECKF